MRQAAEIGAAARSARRQGHGVEFVTLTFSHNCEDELAKLWDGLRIAFADVNKDFKTLLSGSNRFIHSQDKYDTFESLPEKLAHVMAVEATYGPVFGWHPHGHLLIFFERRLTKHERSILRQRLLLSWTQEIHKHLGKNVDPLHGIHIRELKNDLADAKYLVKICDEIAGGNHSKSAKRQRFSAIQLLDGAIEEGCFWKLQRYREFEAAAHCRQLVSGITRTLKAFGVTTEEILGVYDELFGKDKPEQRHKITVVPGWMFVCFNKWDLDLAMLDIVEDGKVGALLHALSALEHAIGRDGINDKDPVQVCPALIRELEIQGIRLFSVRRCGEGVG